MISLAFNKQEAQTNFESFLANATPAVQQVLTYRQEDSCSDDVLVYFDKNTLTMLYQDKSRPRIISGYTGRSKKKAFFTVFSTEEAAKEKCLEWAEGIAKSFARKKQAKEEYKQRQNAILSSEAVPVGTIFESSYGYDCTIVSFWQVVGHKGKQTVLIRKIGKHVVESGQCYDFVIPAVDCFVNEEVLEKRLVLSQYRNDKNVFHLAISDVQTASIVEKNEKGEWEPTYETNAYFR